MPRGRPHIAQIDARQGVLDFSAPVPTSNGTTVIQVRGHNDWYVLLGVLGLLFFSVAFVYSASASFADVRTGSTETFFWSHAVRVIVGVALMVIASRIDYHWLERWSKPMLLVALGLLLYVLLEGTRMKGAQRWIDFGIVSFQPSEFAKFALIAHLAVMIADKRDYIRDFRFSFLPMLVWVIAVCGLIALQPNLSTAMVVLALAMVVLFIGRASFIQIISVVAAGAATGGLYAITAEYRMRRIVSYFGMHSGGGDTLGTLNYQLHQGLLAFGSGGFFGVGPGQSRQRLFLPEPFGDFIYSIIGEEYGFLGAAALLAVFAVIVWRGMVIARNAPDDLGRVLAAGIALTIGVYAVVNAAVTTGLLPTTGLPMPFISYGGSSVLISAVAVGVLLNISQQANVMPLPGSSR